MIVCAHLVGMSTPFLRGVLEGLADHNAAWILERRELGQPVPNPWEIRWVPDGVSDKIEFRDLAHLGRRGRGSCGELAAAYVGWFRAGDELAELEFPRQRADLWHVFARARGLVFDPQEGGGHGQAA